MRMLTDLVFGAHLDCLVVGSACKDVMNFERVCVS